MSSPPTIRPAEPRDVARIADIYNQGIAERIATFETRPRDADEVAAWLDSDHVVLVVEVDGTVAGFARAARYSDRCVYSGVAEHGVYVDRSARGNGLGRTLLDALATAAAEVGVYKLMSRVFTANLASRATHRAAGFTEVGVQRRHGRLEGEWVDVVLVERLIGDAAT